MSNTAKVLLVIVACVVGVCVIGVATAAFWFKQHQGELVSMGRRATEEGVRFGTGQPSPACEAEAIRRADACRGVMCEAESQLFASTCLGASQPTPGYCDGVPAPTAIMDSANWIVARCAAAGHASDPHCRGIEGKVQRYCHPMP